MRIFLALSVTPEVAGALQKGQQRLEKFAPNARWTGLDSFHITLSFLGEVSPERLAVVERAALKTTEGQKSFRVKLKDVGAFSSARADRVIWAGVSEGKDELVGLAARLETNLTAAGFRRERRPYRPHVTLGRLKGDAARGVKIDLEMFFGGFEARELNIMQSELRPQGSMYKVLRRCPFKEHECPRT